MAGDRERHRSSDRDREHHRSNDRDRDSSRRSGRDAEGHRESHRGREASRRCVQRHSLLQHEVCCLPLSGLAKIQRPCSKCVLFIAQGIMSRCSLLAAAVQCREDGNRERHRSRDRDRERDGERQQDRSRDRKRDTEDHSRSRHRNENVSRKRSRSRERKDADAEVPRVHAYHQAEMQKCRQPEGLLPSLQTAVSCLTAG